jgi:hypothetical protein
MDPVGAACPSITPRPLPRASSRSAGDAVASFRRRSNLEASLPRDWSAGTRSQSQPLSALASESASCWLAETGAALKSSTAQCVRSGVKSILEHRSVTRTFLKLSRSWSKPAPEWTALSLPSRARSADALAGIALLSDSVFIESCVLDRWTNRLWGRRYSHRAAHLLCLKE